MKTKLFAFLSIAALAAWVIGCVNTVGGTKTGGMPFVLDQLQGSYKRSVDQVFDAAKAVIASNGKLQSDTTLHSQTNAVRILEGKVNQRTVWVRVQEVDPQVTTVTVQARTSGGGGDVQ